METPWQRFLPPLSFGHWWHTNQLLRLLRACRYVSLIKSLFALALFMASGIDRIPFSVCPKRLDAGQTAKQYNRAKCGIPSTQTTCKRRPLFAAVQSVRGHRVRGGGFEIHFERSEGLTSWDGLLTQGYALPAACLAGCVQTRPVSAHSCSDRLQHIPLRDVRRRARPLAHAITIHAIIILVILWVQGVHSCRFLCKKTSN